jgi:amino acid adenylation domain-containing protein
MTNRMMNGKTNNTIAEFVSYLQSLDVEVFVEGDDHASSNQLRLRCTAPEGILTSELRQELADRKAELISYLKNSKLRSIQPDSNIQTSIQRAIPEQINPQNIFPLSFAQQRLWFLYQLAPNNPFYNVPAAIRLTGKLNQSALERSFQEIVRRHAALRTRFTTVEGQPVQIVEPIVNVGANLANSSGFMAEEATSKPARTELSVVNLQTVAVNERERVTQQLATAEAQRPFNLTTDSLLRVTLLQFSPTESVLLLTMHHIVADGWSLGVLIRELANCYTAFIEGRSPSLPPLPIQYTDFACWQRNWLQGEVLEKQLAYWRTQLQDLPVLELPKDGFASRSGLRSRPAVQTYRGATYPLQISPTLTQSLEVLSQESGVSLFMTLLAAFQTLLYRYTGQEDIAIGSPIANRHRSELEGLIGFFVNSLVMRSDLSGEPTFRELLKRVRNVTLEAYEHQDVPFEKLVEELDPDRDLSRNPLFQIAFALQNAPMQPLELPELRLEPAPLESGTTRFDLEVHLWEPAHGLRSLWQSQEGLSGFISYSTDLFDRDRIGRFIGHFQTLLEGIVANPDDRLSNLPLLTPAERQQILWEWNRNPFPTAEARPLPLKDEAQSNGFLNRFLAGDSSPHLFHEIFEAQVRSAPEAIALVSEQRSLTYEELNQRADRLAYSLQQMGVQPNSLVGLCVDRSADMVAGILGILKAGAAYVPLDPSYPSDRLHFMLTDTQVAILLTQSWLVASLPASPAKIVCLDQTDFPADRSALNREYREEQEQPITPESLAYVIYTSGSTGTPKGVLLTHRGLCNVVAAQQHVFHLSHNSRILQFSSLSFDASIFEIALALGSGGTLYIPPKSAQLPGMPLIQFLADNAITHALLTPAVLAVLPTAELPALRVLITGGEACSSQVVDRWAADRHFFNAYGPTETTIWATVAELSPGDNPSTIGRPILNTQIYILDANLNPVPAGIPGELYIGGAGLAQGYLNRPELTAERFIRTELPEIFSASPLFHRSKRQSSILYKTGDRAQYRTDGTIEFLGRVDHQIKIRGFRVELGEIEATLQRHPAIQDAVVITAGEANETRLIAYFSLNSEHFQQTILQSLQTQHLEHWQTLYNQTYQSPSKIQLVGGTGLTNTALVDNAVITTAEAKTTPNPTFNTTGWNSSYTGKPIPIREMQEWVDDRVQQVLALKPKRVLEIGCGTGLLLFQIAPHCQKYVGTDFSVASLESIQTQLHTLNLTHVELLHRMATDFEGIEPASFDVVILNSIVQYFPSQDYLMQVLEEAIQAVAPGGVVFIGDVRSLPLLTAFHTWVQFCQADTGIERAQLQQQIDRSQFEEPELAIDPAFFDALRDRFSTIRQVQIRLARGRSHNEMTQFRYNVLLHVGTGLGDETQPVPVHSVQHHDWQQNPITVETIQQHLSENQPERLAITNVRNSRIDEAIETVNWLRHKEAPKTVGRMRERLQDLAERAIDPQDWWDLETVLPYSVEITWSTQTDTDAYTNTGDYDVLLLRQGVHISADRLVPRQPSHQINYSSRRSYTNTPLQSAFARQLIPELRQSLGQTLPNYMIPAAFIPLATLPLTASGKVDRVSVAEQYRVSVAEQYRVSVAEQYHHTLPSLSHNSNQSSNKPNFLLTTTESTLIEIWQELLRLKQIHVHDNFFELGGHSLLATQMTSRVRDTFGLELPLQKIFEAPTIAQLAPILETLREATSPAVPPLVRLDRSAYRHKRSALPSMQPKEQNKIEQNKIQISESNLQKPPAIPNVPANKQPPLTSRSPLIPLTLGDSQQPFFCVHPMFGVVFPYLELAHHLGSHRSFYGLQPLGLDGKSPPLNRIEAIASYYVQAIQSLQPHGPYFLGGWSFGGLVAFEMAQQLTQAGQPIGLLAILDTPAPCNKPSFYQSLKFLLGTALWSTLPFLLDYGALATHQLQSRSWFSRGQWSAIVRLLPEESRLQLLDESAIRSLLPIVYANSQATYRYVPQLYPHRLTLFKAAEQPDALKNQPTLNWNTLVNDIQLHQVPGNHLSLLKQPHVQILAQQLGQSLS